MTNRLALNNLRPLRTSARLSQRALADRSGLHQTYISTLERGITPRDPADVNRLADALGVSQQVLLCGRIVIENGDLRLETTSPDSLCGATEQPQ